MKNRKFELIIVLFSIACGILTKDYFFGSILLGCGLLNAYYASLGRVSNYIYGGLYCLLSACVCYKNGLFGIFLLSLILYFPLQIYGYFSWNKKRVDDKHVELRQFSLRDSVIITFSCVIVSILFGLLLSKIPNQQLAFLDSSSNILNLCAVILMNFRYRECWLVWLFNNIFDLSIWIINVINVSPNSFIMLIISIGYLLMNVYGYLNWKKIIVSKEDKL